MSERARAHADALEALRELEHEREVISAALAAPDRAKEQKRARWIAGSAIAFVAITPLVLFASGRSWSRPAEVLDGSRDLMTDAVLTESDALDRCHDATAPVRATLYVSFDTAGVVSNVTARGVKLDGECAKHALRGVRGSTRGRAPVLIVDALLFPKDR